MNVDRSENDDTCVIENVKLSGIVKFTTYFFQLHEMYLPNNFKATGSLTFLR